MVGNTVRVIRVGQALNVSEVDRNGLVVNSMVVPSQSIGAFLDDIETVKAEWFADARIKTGND